MWWKKKTDDTLEWTVSEAGFGDAAEVTEGAPPEAAPAAPVASAAKPLQFPWRRLGWLAAPALFILAALWAWSQWNQWQTRRELEQALIGEISAPRLPLSFLKWDDTQPLRLGTVTQLDVDTLQADAIHTFVAPDGQRYTFATPRYFSRAGESWQPGDPPDPFPSEIRQHTDGRFTLRYYAADAELVEQTVIPYLDKALDPVCAEWECARPATLSFTDRRADWSPATDITLEADEPLLFWLLADGDPQALTQIAAPHSAGYPVDAASRNLWLRALVLRVFSQLAFNEAFLEPRGDQSANTLLQAVIVLEAAKFNLETSRVREYGLNGEANGRLFPQSLLDTGQSASRTGQAQERRDALALLNRFARQWPQADQFNLARDAAFFSLGPGPMAWLQRQSVRDGQPLAEWVNDWRKLLGQPIGPVTIPSGDLLLNCFTGPQIHGDDGLKPVLPLENFPGVAYSFSGWSPTGRYLPLGIGFQPVVLDTQTGRLRLPPDELNAALALPLAWASDSVLVYLAVEAEAVLRGSPPDKDSYQLRFFDLAETARNLPPLTGVGPPFVGPYSYLASPDGQWAALLHADAMGGDGRASLDLLPALGGERRLLAQDGQPPVWSPDSRELAFMDWDAATESSVLRVYTVSTGQTRSVWDSRTWETAALGAQLAWSPDGRWIALAAQPSSSNSLRWLGLIAPDGSNTLRLDTPQRAAGSRSGVNDLQGRQSVPGGTITALAFSNDGRYLALSGSFGQPQLLIYDVADRRIARTISGIESPQLQWSPDDRQLLLSGQGVAVLNSPLDPNSQIEPLTEGENCSFASWKPK
jgi:hypothetical protein